MQNLIATDRLQLRPFREEDLEIMISLFQNPDFMRFSGGALYTREQTITFLNKILTWERESLPFPFAVIDLATERLIGFCGFLHQEVDGQPEIEIAYRLHPGFWNRGLATEAARAVRDHAFQELHLPRVISMIHPENLASRRVAEKNGLRLEKETLFRGFPTLVYALGREDWLETAR